MSGAALVVVVAAVIVAVILVPGVLLVWPSRGEAGCRIDLGVALLTGALIAFTVLGVQIVFDWRLAEADRARQEEQDRRDALLSMKLAISSQDNLTGIQLENLDLSRFYFGGKTLTYAQMRGTRLIEAVLDHVDLEDADLSGADLRRANLDGANLRGAFLTSARLDEATAAGTNFTRADLKGAVLRDVDLSGAKLQGADLTGAQLASDALSLTQYDARTRWPAHLKIAKCRDGATCTTPSY